MCRVCGDGAHSLHFGGLSCDSCKAFFRRSVQSGAHREFRCLADNPCRVTVASRRCCQVTLFQMNLSGDMQELATTRDTLLACRRARVGCEGTAVQEAVAVVKNFCERAVSSLIGGPYHVPDTVLLQGSLLYLGSTSTTPNYERLDCERETNFMRGLLQLRLDDTSLSLLLLILALGPFDALQESQVQLLRRYMQWRLGPTVASRLFPKAFAKLGDVHELSEGRDTQPKIVQIVTEAIHSTEDSILDHLLQDYVMPTAM